MTNISTIKQWFRNGLKPTQEQFWAWMDSYWHKGEEIPQNSIKGLDKSLEAKAETSAVEAKANKDASGLSEENKVAWKEVLGVGKIPENIAKIDTDSEQGNVYDKTQVDDLLENSGKNIGNSDLETTSTRTFTQAHIYTHNTGGYPYRITGLADKSVDTMFNNVLVENSNGDVAITTNSALLVNGIKAMNDTQKDQWRASLLKTNEKYSTGQPRVDVLLPPLIDLSTSVSSILTVGINLFINNVDRVSTIDIIKVSNNEVVETIQNVMVHQTMPTQLTFDINKSLYVADEDYTIQITHNGIKSILNKNATFRVVSQIIQKEVDMQWKLINHSRTIGEAGSIDFFSDAKSFSISQPAGSRLIERGIVNVVSKKEFDLNKGYMFFISFSAVLPSSNIWIWFNNIWMSFVAQENVNENANFFYGDNETAIISQSFNDMVRIGGVSKGGIGGSGFDIQAIRSTVYNVIIIIKGGVAKFVYGDKVVIKRIPPSVSNLYTIMGSFFKEYNDVHHSLLFSVDNIVEF